MNFTIFSFAKQRLVNLFYLLALTVVCVFFLQPLSAATLGQEFSQAKPGDFVVIAYQKQITLLLIKENFGNKLILEEISAPYTVFEKYKGKWQEWLRRDAPHHTSWTVSTMNKNTYSLESVYSVEDDTYQIQDQTLAFLPTLLALNLNPIDLADRKYSGPKPLAGEHDFRKLWEPKIYYDGIEIHPSIQVVRVIWPDDGSDLAGKNIDLYLPEQKAITYFPYWVEVVGKLSKVKVRVIDSGRNLVPSRSPVTPGTSITPLSSTQSS